MRVGAQLEGKTSRLYFRWLRGSRLAQEGAAPEGALPLASKRRGAEAPLYPGKCDSNESKSQKSKQKQKENRNKKQKMKQKTKTENKNKNKNKNIGAPAARLYWAHPNAPTKAR
jgi:Mg-chelatase subunit ChlI